ERNGRNLPPGSVAVIEANEFRSESQGKGQNLHTGPTGHEEVAELVEEHHDRQDEQKRDHIADQGMTEALDTMHQKIDHSVLARERIPPYSPKMRLRQFEARGWRPNIARYGQRPARHRRSPGPSRYRSAAPLQQLPRPGVRSCRT